MEPYPKSRAKQLHPNEIEIEKESLDKVAFVPFLGISPLRYRDIFLKAGKRKSDSGFARTWFASSDEGEPMLDIVFNAHPDLEKQALASFIGKFEQRK